MYISQPAGKNGTIYTGIHGNLIKSKIILKANPGWLIYLTG